MQVVLKENPFDGQHGWTEVIEEADELVLKLCQSAGGIEMAIGGDDSERSSLATAARTGLEHGITAASETGVDSKHEHLYDGSGCDTAGVRFASWNVNGIRARAERVEHWLTWRRPDVLALQELRCPGRSFPHRLFSGAGYHVARLEHTALASAEEVTDVVDLMDDGRVLLASTASDNVRTISIYAPNGTKAGTARHQEKLAWFDALADALEAVLAADRPVLLMGDLNIAHDDRDVWAPDRYRRRNLFTAAERERLDRLIAIGFTDLFRHHHDGRGAYTWWNYAHDSFNRNRGWRLDYLMGTAPLIEASSHVVVDVEERAEPGTSDHAPLWVDLKPTR